MQGMWVAMISTMWTARPTTGSPFSFTEAGTAPFDPMSSCFSLFGRLDPADPFIARERSNVLPRLQRFYVGGQCLFQVRGQVMDHAACDLFCAQSFAHKFIARVASACHSCSFEWSSHNDAGHFKRDYPVGRDARGPGRYGVARRCLTVMTSRADARQIGPRVEHRCAGGRQAGAGLPTAKCWLVTTSRVAALYP